MVRANHGGPHSIGAYLHGFYRLAERHGGPLPWNNPFLLDQQTKSTWQSLPVRGIKGRARACNPWDAEIAI